MASVQPGRLRTSFHWMEIFLSRCSPSSWIALAVAQPVEPDGHLRTRRRRTDGVARNIDAVNGAVDLAMIDPKKVWLRYVNAFSGATNANTGRPQNANGCARKVKTGAGHFGFDRCPMGKITQFLNTTISRVRMLTGGAIYKQTKGKQCPAFEVCATPCGQS